MKFYQMHALGRAMDPILRPLRFGALVLALLWALYGCASQVTIPPVAHFSMVTHARSGQIDVAASEAALLNDLYLLLKANEGEKIDLCTADRETRACTKDGVSVFVQGGPIPGFGKRKHNIIKNVRRNKRQLVFVKDNGSTSFIGIPMYAKDNSCEVSVCGGGLQVDMTRYYANWAGVGMMTMAEGWAIDYIDLKNGIVGCQLALDIKGPLTIGGTSKYVLLTFPNIPDGMNQASAGYRFVP